jgi:hypothetical protein
VQLASRRVVAEITGKTSTLAGETLKWIARRCDVQQLESYFAHPQAMPLLALPWWLEKSIRGEVDRDFQSALMTSSMQGYLFIRMVDDLMDGHDIDRACLPALHLFSFEFQSAYFRYFSSGDPFWNHFGHSLASMAEAVSADCGLTEISAQEFAEVSARKSAAALIPLAAVCCRYGRLDLLPEWEGFLSLFARWHQMRDDIVDWSEDYASSLTTGRSTWILSEAERRRSPDETVPVWMGRTGLSWAAGVMDGWKERIRSIANRLGSPELIQYLKGRDEMFSRQMAANIRLAALFDGLLAL